MSLTFDQAQRQLEDAAIQAPETMRQEISAGANRALTPIQRGTPVKTGRLRRSWRVSRSSTGARIVNAAPYASDLEDQLDELIRGELDIADRSTVTDIERRISESLGE